MAPDIRAHPLTPDRWEEFERLFGPGGGYGGCWCMYFRMRSAEFARAKPAERKAAMKAVVESAPPGLLLYADGEPAGWVSLDRRERFVMLERSRVYKAVDEQPVWTIVCFVVGRRFRRQGMMGRLLEAAIDYGRQGGARILEAYPIEIEGEAPLKGYAGYTGFRSVFERAGFREAARLANGRPVMRLELR